VEYWRRNG
jgi:hypothetical protein